MSDEPGEASPDAERRLAEHLELLRAERPTPGTTLVKRVVRTARWQQAVRAPLRVAGMIAGAIVDGFLRLVSPSDRKRG